MKLLRSCIACALTAALGGCTTVIGPASTPPSRLEASFFAPAHYIDADYETGIVGLPLGQPLTDSSRQFVVRYVRQIDHNYAAYSSWLSSGRASVDMAYDSTGLATTGLSAISTVTGVKTALAAISTFAQGQKSSIDKNYYQGKVIFTLINVMEVSRTALRDKLRRALLTPTYTLQEALFDLEEYFRAGSIDTALSSASINASGENDPTPPDKGASAPAGAVSASTAATAAASATAATAGAASAHAAAVNSLLKGNLTTAARANFSALAASANALSSQANAAAQNAQESAIDARAATAAQRTPTAPTQTSVKPRYPSTSRY
jgi:hypothetical protein